MDYMVDIYLKSSVFFWYKPPSIGNDPFNLLNTNNFEFRPPYNQRNAFKYPNN